MTSSDAAINSFDTYTVNIQMWLVLVKKQAYSLQWHVFHTLQFYTILSDQFTLIHFKDMAEFVIWFIPL